MYIRKVKAKRSGLTSSYICKCEKHYEFDQKVFLLSFIFAIHHHAIHGFFYFSHLLKIQLAKTILYHTHNNSKRNKNFGLGLYILDRVIWEKFLVCSVDEFFLAISPLLRMS